MLKINLIPILLFLVGVFSYTQAQVVPSLKQDSLKIDEANKKIIIPYQLSDGSDYKYDYTVEMYITQDGGTTYLGPLQKLKGFHGDRIMANDTLALEAWWYYAEEYPEFDGQNMRVKLKVNYKPSVFNFQNEGAMKYSAILPGWGQTKVKPRKGWKYKWLATSLLVYSAIGGSFIMQNQANNTYSEYENSRTRADAQSLYDKAVQEQRYAYGLAILAGGIWATDIVLVGLKGRKNRLEKEKIIEKNRQMKSEVGVAVSQNLYNMQYIPMLSMKLKF